MSMKFFYLPLLLIMGFNLAGAKGAFYIRAIKPFALQGETINGIKQHPMPDQLGGWFRLKEFDASLQQMVETDMVTYFIAHDESSVITLNINCAKPINLSYRLSDVKGRHSRFLQEPNAYQRINQSIDLSSFRNGRCTIDVISDKGEIIYTIEFEKVAK